MRIKLDEGAQSPTRAHQTDAGLDIRSNESGTLYAHTFRAFHTGLHIELPQGTVGLLCSRSGMNIRQGITSTGVIDEGYTGEILVNLINHSDEDVYINAGDRISQLLVLPVFYEPIKIVEELDGSERGEDGFGSTGLS